MNLLIGEALVGGVVQLGTIVDQQVKAGVAIAAEAFYVVRSRMIARQKIANQLPTRCRVVPRFIAGREVGEGGKAAVAVDPQPAAPGGQVATGKDGRIIVPVVCSQSGPGVEFIAVCSN